jgi:hypothetical protein
MRGPYLTASESKKEPASGILVELAARGLIEVQNGLLTSFLKVGTLSADFCGTKTSPTRSRPSIKWKSAQEPRRM